VAYVFDVVNGNVLRTVHDPGLAAGDFFGAAVGASATTIVVGSPGFDGSTVDRGAAYLVDGRILPWHNSPKPLDVTHDTHIAANVAVAIVNYINAGFATAVPADAQIGSPYGFLDVTWDDFVAANDVVAVINAIYAGQGGEGEQTSAEFRVRNQSHGSQSPVATCRRPVGRMS
jgi:hypothetical protein